MIDRFQAVFLHCHFREIFQFVILFYKIANWIRFSEIRNNFWEWVKSRRIFSFSSIDLVFWSFLFCFFVWFARFQILICEPQSIWHKFLVLSWLYIFGNITSHIEYIFDRDQLSRDPANLFLGIGNSWEYLFWNGILLHSGSQLQS